jgi:hypothetical protein
MTAINLLFSTTAFAMPGLDHLSAWNGSVAQEAL